MSDELDNLRHVVVLAEDESATTPANHGPTALLLALLADRMIARGHTDLWDPWSLRGRVTFVPCGPGNKVLAKCRGEYETWRHRRPIVALMDRDRIYRPLKTERQACLTLLREAFFQCPDKSGRTCHPDVEPVFLEDNIETVCCHIADIEGVDEALRTQAIDRKNRAARDRLLHRVAQENKGRERSELERRVKSLARLADKVFALLVNGSASEVTPPAEQE